MCPVLLADSHMAANMGVGNLLVLQIMWLAALAPTRRPVFFHRDPPWAKYFRGLPTVPLHVGRGAVTSAAWNGSVARCELSSRDRAFSHECRSALHHNASTGILLYIHSDYDLVGPALYTPQVQDLGAWPRLQGLFPGWADAYRRHYGLAPTEPLNYQLLLSHELPRLVHRPTAALQARIDEVRKDQGFSRADIGIQLRAGGTEYVGDRVMPPERIRANVECFLGQLAHMHGDSKTVFMTTDTFSYIEGEVWSGVACL